MHYRKRLPATDGLIPVLERELVKRRYPELSEDTLRFHQARFDAESWNADDGDNARMLDDIADSLRGETIVLIPRRSR